MGILSTVKRIQLKHMNHELNTGDLENEEWLAWYSLTPQERWRETEKLWDLYVSMGGSLDPEPDPQSPFYFGDEPKPPASVYVTRRDGKHLAVIASNE